MHRTKTKNQKQTKSCKNDKITNKNEIRLKISENHLFPITIISKTPLFRYIK